MAPNSDDLVILIKRRKNKVSAFFELFEKESVISIKDIKKKTSASSFYKLALREIISLNNAVKQINPGLEVIRPAFKQDITNGPVYHALEKAENVDISHNDNFIFLKFSG